MPFPRAAARRMLMIIGPPAAGKSTLMRALTSRWQPWPRPHADPPHVLYLDHLQQTHALELGTLRADYPGTDALPMTVITRAVQWLALDTAPLVLLEGSRLAVPRWLDAAGTHGFHVLVALLDTDQDELDRRCAARGSHQSPAWRQGTATRARNLHAYAAGLPHCATVALDATLPTTTLSNRLWKEIQ